MNDLKRIGWNTGLVECAITLIVLTCSVYGEQTQIINANLAGQIEEKDFAFTPLKKEDASIYAKLLLTDLPPRLQKEPFSIPEGSDAADIFSHPFSGG